MVRLLVAVLGFSAIVAAAEGAENSDPWLGTWVNADPDTHGITRFVVSEGKNGRTIQAWGRCHPQDCNWGETPLTYLSYSPHRFATWDKKFADFYLILRPDKDEIAAEDYCIYKDNSGRRSYRVEYRFKRPER